MNEQKTVLVVDDSATILKTAAIMLEKAGYNVLTAVDGLDAISQITENKPDLVLVDIVMPNIDGYQTCSLVKRNKRYRNTPVVMISSRDGVFDRARGSIAGAEGHIHKPFTAPELVNVVANFTSAN